MPAPCKNYKLTSGLIPSARPVTFPRMSFLAALLAWLFIAAVMVGTLIWATHGAIWAFAIAFLAFTFCFARYGCMTH